MKDYTIGRKTTVKLCENLDEISIKRWTAVQQYMITKQTGSDLVDVKDFWTKFCQSFDANSPSQMFIHAHDWVHGLSLVERGDNPDQFIFGLITLEEGEEMHSYEPDFLREKLKRYSKAGLNQGEVKREVENFILGILAS